MQLGSASAAVSSVETILKANPNDRETILTLGFACARGRKFRLAIAYLGRVPELVRQRPDHVAALARAYYATGQRQKGRVQVLQMQEALPDPNALYLGGQIALEAADWETAEKVFIAAKAGHPKPDLILYKVVAENLETSLSRQWERDHPVPRFVERELRLFLDCGVPAHGFLRVHCDDCGEDRIAPSHHQPPAAGYPAIACRRKSSAAGAAEALATQGSGVSVCRSLSEIVICEDHCKGQDLEPI